MKSRIKNVLKSTPFNIFMIFVLAGIVSYFVLKDDGDLVLAMVHQVSFWAILGLISLMVIERALLGYGLMRAARLTHPKYSWFSGFINAYVAGLFCGITPGASGGQIAQSYLFKKQGVGISRSIGILWLEFIVYQTTMTVVVLILILLRFSYFYNNYSQFFFIVILGFLVSATIIVFLWLLAKSPKFYTWVSDKGIIIGHRLHIVKDIDEAKEKLHSRLETFDTEIKILQDNKGLIGALVTENVIRLLILYSIPIFCAFALHIKVEPKNIINIICLSSFVAMVNAFLPMPGSAGGTEATFVLMFSTIFSSIDAKSIMILWRFVTYYQVLIIGGIIFAITKFLPPKPVEEAIE